MTDQPTLPEPEDLLPAEVMPETEPEDLLPSEHETSVAPNGLTVPSDDAEDLDAPGGTQPLMSSSLI